MADKINPKVLIPIIRKVMPQVIAESIVNIQPMTVPKLLMETGEGYYENGTVYYYWAKISVVAFDLRDSVKKNEEILQWCFETYGAPGLWDLNDGQRWMSTNAKYYFANESDRMLFVLKWNK